MVKLTLICYDGNKKLKIWKKAIYMELMVKSTLNYGTNVRTLLWSIWHFRSQFSKKLDRRVHQKSYTNQTAALNAGTHQGLTEGRQGDGGLVAVPVPSIFIQTLFY